MRQNSPRMPVPEHCDSCASTNVVYTDNSAIYGRSYGEWPKAYLCLDCRASVGCHPNTDIPLGRMAGKETKVLRQLAHASFDVLWKDKYMTRTQAYNWLARQLGIAYEDCHMSQLTNEQLRTAAQVSKEYFAANQKSLERRKEKRNAKLNERREREFKRTKRHIRTR